MMKHKPVCWTMTLLIVIGGLNWGLVGIGGFLGKDLNVVHLLLGSWPSVEWVVYILVGLSALFNGYVMAFKVEHPKKPRTMVRGFFFGYRLPVRQILVDGDGNLGSCHQIGRLEEVIHHAVGVQRIFLDGPRISGEPVC